jgi:hypothetical protein
VDWRCGSKNVVGVRSTDEFAREPAEEFAGELAAAAAHLRQESAPASTTSRPP